MKKKRRNIFSYVILSVWSLIIIGILGWVLMSSFKTNLEIYQTPWAMPAKATLENYHSAWSTMKMSSYFMNSVVIVFASILGCTVISALTSFALTRYEFKGRKALLNLLIFSMSVPSQLLLIPLYDQLLNLGLVNTRTGLRQHRTIHKRHFSEQQQPRKARITLLIDSREHTASSRQAGPVSQKQIC